MEGAWDAGCWALGLATLLLPAVLALCGKKKAHEQKNPVLPKQGKQPTTPRYKLRTKKGVPVIVKKKGPKAKAATFDKPQLMIQTKASEKMSAEESDSDSDNSSTESAPQTQPPRRARSAQGIGIPKNLTRSPRRQPKSKQPDFRGKRPQHHVNPFDKANEKVHSAPNLLKAMEESGQGRGEVKLKPAPDPEYLMMGELGELELPAPPPPKPAPPVCQPPSPRPDEPSDPPPPPKQLPKIGPNGSIYLKPEQQDYFFNPGAPPS